METWFGIVFTISIALFSVANATGTKDENAEKMDIQERLLIAVQKLEEKVETLERERENDQQKIAKLESDLLQATTLNKPASSAVSDTLFFATMSDFETPVTSSSIIVWNTAVVNPGGYYSTETGGYTVNFNGYYQFTVMKRGNNNKANFRLFVDSQPYSVYALHTYFGEPGACVTINIQLTAGQVVSVENEHSTVLYGGGGGGYNSWFSGFLLFTL